MGRENVGRKAKLKAGGKPENLRVKGKKKKLGPFGESYGKSSAPAKGIRVTESMRESFRKKFRAWRESVEDEVTPPGREEQVRKLKKNKNIDNPWAVAWDSYNDSKDECRV